MFLLGIYCAGGYSGSVSAILINTPGTPHAATMLDGYHLSKKVEQELPLKLHFLHQPSVVCSLPFCFYF